MNKLYVCKKYPQLSMGGMFHFVGGSFETADPQKQAIMEGSMSFRCGLITCTEKPPPNTIRVDLGRIPRPAVEPLIEPKAAPEPEAPPAEPKKKFLSQLNKGELELLAQKNGIEKAQTMSRQKLYAAMKKLVSKGKVVAGLT